ncbi:MAG: VanZ family protein [Acetivibrio sp.]
MGAFFKKRQAWYWIPTILIMSAIFSFSHQPSNESGKLSGGISYQIVSLVNNITHQNWSKEICQIKAEKIEHPIRKAAHMMEYGILCISVLFAEG